MNITFTQHPELGEIIQQIVSWSMNSYKPFAHWTQPMESKNTGTNFLSIT